MKLIDIKTIGQFNDFFEEHKIFDKDKTLVSEYLLYPVDRDTEATYYIDELENFDGDFAPVITLDSEDEYWFKDWDESITIEKVPPTNCHQYNPCWFTSYYIMTTEDGTKFKFTVNEIKYNLDV